MPVTMKQLAEAAGVSRSAVSCVLNGYRKARVGPAKQEEILRLAAKMGYCRNEVATTIKTGRSKVIALTGMLRGDDSMEIAIGVNQALSAAGYSLKLIALDDDRTPALEAVDDICRHCHEQMVAGVIFHDLNQVQVEALHRSLPGDRIPILQVGFDADHPRIGKIHLDVEAAARLGVEHLVGLGHRRVGLVDYSDRPAIHRRRVDAFRAAMAAAGLEVLPELVLPLPYPTTFDVGSPLCRWLKEKRPEALLALAERLSFQILLACNQLGWSLPRDLSVVGYGGSSLAEWTCPPLTAIRPAFREMGCRAAQLMVSSLAAKTWEPQEILVPATLELRKSTAPCRLAGVQTDDGGCDAQT